MNLTVEGLSFSYGKQAVLRDVSFSAGSGELIAVLGQNGAGKSTLFRCLLGLLHGWQGSITLDDLDLRHLGSRETARRIAYIPQSSIPVFSYTVLDTVLMGTASRLGVLQSPGTQQEAEALSLLQSLGIGHLAGRSISQCSGGERQLALIARALNQQAVLLVMDEPTASLDYGNQYRVLETVRALTGQGYTVLMSTHNPEHVFRFADRVLLLHEGRLLANGRAEEVLTPERILEVFGLRAELRRVSLGDREVTVCLPL